VVHGSIVKADKKKLKKIILSALASTVTVKVFCSEAVGNSSQQKYEIHNRSEVTVVLAWYCFGLVGWTLINTQTAAQYRLCTTVYMYM